MIMRRYVHSWNILKVLLIAFFLYYTTSQEACSEDQFTCHDTDEIYSDSDTADDYYGSQNNSDYYDGEESQNATCISNTATCNGVGDCPDCSDEKNCTPVTVFWCGEEETTGFCVSLTQQCNNITDCPDGRDECDCPGSFRCQNHTSSTTCVPAPNVCDGTPDCHDGEDESSCPMYECPSNNLQVLESKLCNGINDCGDTVASDECNCTSTFVCDSGECIHNNLVCNGIADCLDGSDECECPAINGSNPFFRCMGSRKCIEQSRVCNGNLDCGSYIIQENVTLSQRQYYVMDCSDELEASCSTHFLCSDAHNALRSGIITRDLKACVPQYERCDGTSNCDDASDECGCPDSVSCPKIKNQDEPMKQCMLRRNFCDATDHCTDGSDELSIGFGFKCNPGLTHLRNTPCILPQFMIDDGVADCGSQADICYRNGKWRCFRCVDNSMLISDEQVCDGIIDCPDLSDECMCSTDRPDVCNAVCEMDGGKNCKRGTLKCDNGSRSNSSSIQDHDVPFSRICDDSDDCFDRSTSNFIDENSCVGQAESVKDMRCPVGGTTNPLRPLHATRCDGRPECADFADECDLDNPCPTVPKFCENVSASVDHRLRGERRFPCSKGLVNTSVSDSIGLPGGLVCNGVVDCAVYGEDEIHCPMRYSCDTGDHMVSIDDRQKCDGRIDCLDGSDEVNCTEHFYCENGDPMFVPKYVRFDGRDDCSDKSDECPKEQLEGAFASNAEMIANPFLRVLVWIMATISTFGNFAVIVHQIMIFVKHKKHGGQNVALCNRVMILNLATADLLTGIYLFVVAGNVLYYSGAYCHEDKLWRTSTSCANLGLLNSIATEAAVVILVIMTTYRLLAVYKPFYTTSVRPAKVMLLCISSWIVVLSLMMIPRIHGLADYFSKSAWYPLPFFDNDVVKKTEIVELIRRYNVLTGSNNTDIDCSWTTVEKFVRERYFNESRFALFGYYSKHSVCIPNMLAGHDDAAVGFSAFITGLNLCAFSYVVIAYLFIYRGAVEKTESRSKQYSINNSYVMRSYSTKPLTGDKEKNKSNSIRASTLKSTAMQNRIYRLVASNLACWLPLTIMAVANLFGAKLSAEAYAVAAIVLLPITSALNPILYSNFISVAWEWIKEYCFCTKRKSETLTQDSVPVTNRSQLSSSMKSARV